MSSDAAYDQHDISVSVIIAVYNGEAYLAETIASVQRQSYQPLEIIVVDDGSTDATIEIAERANVRVLKQVRRGVSAARNLGTSCALGSWVAFVDADDVWLPGKLRSQIAALRLAPHVDVCFCDYYNFTNTHVLDASVLHEVHRNFATIQRRALGGDAYLCDGASLSRVTNAQHFVLPSVLVVRRTTLLEVGGFSTSLTCSEDVDVTLRLLRDSDAAYVDSALMGYRHHLTNTTKNLPRMRLGTVKLALMMINEPKKYRPESVDYFRAQLGPLLLGAGRAFALSGNLKDARALINCGLAFRRSIFGYALMLLLPVMRLRAVQQRAAYASLIFKNARPFLRNLHFNASRASRSLRAKT